jgi:type IV fimbrial biogenesis protein FimT
MPTLPNAWRRARGFTILELMVTVFIAAILFALAIPSFRQMVASNRLATQSNDLIGGLNFARSEAITRNRTVRLCRAANEAATDCSGTVANWGAWIVRNDVTGEVSRRGVVNTFGGAIVVRSTLPQDIIIFGADGLSRTTTNVLVNNQTFLVCTPPANIATDNRREMTLGASSRLTLVRTTGACAP